MRNDDYATERAAPVFPQGMPVGAGGPTDVATLRAANADLRARVDVLQSALAVAERAALYDALTALPNRRLFEDRLAQAIASASREGRRDLLVMVDVDDFKSVNDAHGHGAGDHVLRALADALRQAIRATDTACRLGGDEFVVLLIDVGDAAGQAAAVGKLRDACEPVRCELDAYVTASVGVASFPDDGSTPARLLATADRRMYVAKAAQKGPLRREAG